MLAKNIRGGLLYAIALSLLYFAQADTEGEIRDAIYYSLNDAKPCVRLLNMNGEIGCATEGTAQGVLRLVRNAPELSALVQSAPSDKLAVLLPSSMLSLTNVDALSALNIAGIIVTDAQDITGYSGDSSTPQPRFADGSYPWNPTGDGLMYQKFDFAIIHLSGVEAATMVERAAENEARRASGKYLWHVAEFLYDMSASGSSEVCLSQRSCLPVGGHSVWWSVEQVRNDSKPTVVAAAAFDAKAVFHDLAAGAESAVTGTVGLLAAAAVVSQNPHTFALLPKRILFTLFNGEQWGYVGSRRFLADITNFQCDVPTQTPGECSRPYRPDPAFRNLQLSQFDSVIELNQIGLEGTLYAHTSKPASAASTTLKAQVQAAASSVPGIAVSDAASGTPGLPPSSTQSFLKSKPGLAAVVLTDHSAQFRNRFYQSIYDTAKNVVSNSSNTDVPAALCRAATLTARALYTAAGGTDTATRDALSADCTSVNALWECLAVDFQCALGEQLMSGYHRQKTPNHYAGVYIIRSPARLGGVPRFIFEYLQSLKGNGTAHFHDAVDPVLKFNYDSRRWEILNKTASPVWTESNWDFNIGARAFMVEDSSVEVAMLVVGLLLFASGYAAAHFIMKYCDRKFKTL